MSTFWEIFQNIIGTNPFHWLILALIMKITVILGAAFFIHRFLQHTAAAYRHFFWLLTFASILLLPILMQTLPTWQVPLLPAVEAPAETPIISAPPAAIQSPAVPERTIIDNNMPLLQPEAATETKTAASPFPWQTLLVIGGSIWLIGAVLMLLKGLLETGGIWFLFHRASSPANPAWTAAMSRTANQLGLHQPLRLKISEHTPVPVTFGFFSPVILLPKQAIYWPESRRNVVILHELAHIKRMDYLSNLLIQLTCAFYWFHPLVWLAARRANLERELASDDWVIRLGTANCDYAEHLLEIARGLANGNQLGSRAVAMADTGELKSRIQRILSAKIHRHGLTRSATVLAFLLCLTFLLPLSVLQLQEQSIAASCQLSAAEKMPSTDRQLIIANLRSDQPDIQKQAAWQLGTKEDADALPMLIEALSDKDAGVRAMAAWALGEIKSPEAITPLMNALTAEETFAAREMFIRALGEHESTIAIPALISQLDNVSPDIRYVAVWALGEINAPEAIAAVQKSLNDSEASVREIAVEAFGRYCNPANVDALISRLNDDDAGVRLNTVRMLGRQTMPQAIDGLIHALKDANAAVRSAAAQSLGQRKKSTAIPALITALQDPSPQVRAMVVWAMDEIEMN